MGYALLEFRDIELQRNAAQKMEQFIKESRLSHNLIGGTIIRSGYPENQICLVADAQKTDLIVMAAHGSRLSTMKPTDLSVGDAGE
jgi:nucleotide-binding universal stress UspA family protein